ncbi:MAG: deoxyribonuclease IV [Chloroflexi bacterium]|nr:deoxyribonuclease IV [Chloroflexota bacterium]
MSTSGGLPKAVERALQIEAQAIQIFCGAPQQWAEPKCPEHEVEGLRAGLAEHDLGPLFIHAPYLINLASAKPQVRHLSRESLATQLRWADRLGAQGVIVHVGSPGASASPEQVDGALDLIVTSIGRIMTEHQGDAAIILENDAGAGARIGKTFGQLGAIVRALSSESRLKLCFDTCHALVSGYEIRTPEGLEGTIAELDREVGIDRLCVIHANDAKAELGTNKDRHENIGEGTIGIATFRRMLSHRALRDLPFILEVPGYKEEGPDLENVRALKGAAPLAV